MHQWIWNNVGSVGFISYTFLPIQNSSDSYTIYVSMYLRKRLAEPIKIASSAFLRRRNQLCYILAEEAASKERILF